MKKRIFFTLFLLFCTALSFAQTPSGKSGAVQDTAFDRGSNIVFPEMTPQLVDNLDLLGRVWGFLKYHQRCVQLGLRAFPDAARLSAGIRQQTA